MDSPIRRPAEQQADEDAVFDLVRQNKGLGQLARALHDRFPHYTGVYIYLLERDILVLTAFEGRPTEHVRIPVGEGVCGRAARLKSTVSVDDVTADADYIACSLETRSELVVPIMRGGQVLGELDIDSDIPAAFSAADRAFLEELARRLEPSINRER